MDLSKEIQRLLGLSGKLETAVANPQNDGSWKDSVDEIQAIQDGLSDQEFRMAEDKLCWTLHLLIDGAETLVPIPGSSDTTQTERNRQQLLEKLDALQKRLKSISSLI